MQHIGQYGQEQFQSEHRVHDRDIKNLENKEIFLDQLIEMGYEIISHKIGFDGWMDGTHVIEAIVKKNGILSEVKLSTADVNPEWFIEHSCGGASPLRLNTERKACKQ